MVRSHPVAGIGDADIRQQHLTAAGRCVGGLAAVKADRQVGPDGPLRRFAGVSSHPAGQVHRQQKRPLPGGSG